MTAAVKRAVDMILAAAALLILSPLLAGLWLAVRLACAGPAVDTEEHLDRHGRPFTTYKIRSGADDADRRRMPAHERARGRGRQATRRVDHSARPPGGPLGRRRPGPRPPSAHPPAAAANPVRERSQALSLGYCF